MDAAERRDLIERANRQSATIGQQLPETITVGDDDLPLEEFVIETRKVEGIPDDLKPVVREAQVELTNERKQLVDRLESAPIDREEGEEVVERIVGIDRARNALQSLRRDRFGSEVQTATLDGHERWLEFVDAIRG
ncbi:DUF5788 family protein [Natronolimnohabitans innermongolicus]|uniref:Uncharacterized protein n=1 Tax=Natronolimnohabitans innermongolicus JCM 12255 TaxID=1227499 RepID=L9X077_9EURY|nr:DUF5788 family protein [Natronolimnohabitans innermongolicus]ELY55120.1 hypothetical protein C493_11577 [Natronolimnohabitans innermongolicus JCM 12255]